MKYSAFMMMIPLLLAGTVVWAAGPGGCPVTAPAQVKCPTPCPTMQPACPCPAAVPAAAGAGPARVLAGLECPQFDPAYAQKMYEQNSVIIAVTQFGAQRATDSNLRDISREINGYMTSANSKLAGWFGCRAPMAGDCPRVQAIIAELSTQCGECFDVAYATTLSTLLKQSNCAEELGGMKAVTQPMRQQAEFLAGKTADWTFRLDRWVSDNGHA